MQRPTFEPKDRLSKKYRYEQCIICNGLYLADASDKRTPLWKRRCPDHKARIDAPVSNENIDKSD